MNHRSWGPPHQTRLSAGPSSTECRRNRIQKSAPGATLHMPHKKFRLASRHAKIRENEVEGRKMMKNATHRKTDLATKWWEMYKLDQYLTCLYIDLFVHNSHFHKNHPSTWHKVSQNFHRHSSNIAKATMCPRVECFCQRNLPKQIQKQPIYKNINYI